MSRSSRHLPRQLTRRVRPETPLDPQSRAVTGGVRAGEDTALWLTGADNPAFQETIGWDGRTLTDRLEQALIDAGMNPTWLCGAALVGEYGTYIGTAFTGAGAARTTTRTANQLVKSYAEDAARLANTADRISGPLWTSTKSKSPAENALAHFDAHKAEFPQLNNSLEYVAESFLRTPPPGTLTITRSNGDVVRYNPQSNHFGVMDSAGAPRTYFKPDPDAHGYSTNLDYFYAQ